jgi:hypothetical protein
MRPNQVVVHQSANNAHPFHDLPVALVNIILEYKKGFEECERNMYRCLKIFHDVYIQGKALHGLMLTPQMGDAPPWVIQGVIIGATMCQKMGDKWYTVLRETEICTSEVIEEAAAWLGKINEMKDAPHPMFAYICQKALKAYPFQDFDRE